MWQVTYSRGTRRNGTRGRKHRADARSHGDSGAHPKSSKCLSFSEASCSPMCESLIAYHCRVCFFTAYDSCILRVKQDLSSNKLQKLSEGIAEIVQLEELVLANNYLVELPKNTQHLTNLKILDARYRCCLRLLSVTSAVADATGCTLSLS